MRRLRVKKIIRQRVRKAKLRLATLRSKAKEQGALAKKASSSCALVAQAPSTTRDRLVHECRGLLHFLWLHHSHPFDRRPSEIMKRHPTGEWDIGFDLWFDWDSVQPVTHTVSGMPNGVWGDTSSSWLRVELKDMDGPPMEDSHAWCEPIVGYHGTRWPKLPWILQQKRLRAGPRIAGGTRGVWSSTSFQVADLWAAIASNTAEQ